MAGVDADAYARLVLHAVDQVGQLFEGEAQIGTLPRRIFDYGRHAVRLVQRDVDRLGDPVERLFGRDLLQVASGVEVQTVQSQLLAALHLVEKRRARLFQPVALRMSEVDQVRIVWQDLGREVAVLVADIAERVDLRRRQRRGDPLPLVFGEKREGRGPYLVRIGGGVLHTSRSAYVCSDIFHMIVSVLT